MWYIEIVSNVKFYGQRRLHKVTQKYYIIVVGLLKITVIFTGLSFNSIAKMQQFSQSVIEYDYSIEVLLNSMTHLAKQRLSPLKRKSCFNTSSKANCPGKNLFQRTLMTDGLAYLLT